MNEVGQSGIAHDGDNIPDGEVFEIIEIMSEYENGRHPRRGHLYRINVDNVNLEFQHDHSETTEILQRIGKDPDQGWVLYEVMHGKDVRLAPHQTVHFRRHGLERFHTRQEVLWVIVNGRRKEIHQHRLTFEEVVALAFPTAPPGENIIYAVAYRNSGDPKHPEGSLVAGASVKIKDGTIFDVTATDKS